MANDREALCRGRATASRSIVNDGPGLIAWRLLAGFGGGYLLISGLVALMGSALPLLGLPRGEAVSLGTLVALFVYVPACLLMFATQRPLRDGVLLLAGAIALVSLAKLI